MKRRPNPVAFVVTLATIVVLGGATHFLHAYQVKRNASALLVQATRLEEEGKAEQAADCLFRYVQFVPEDDEAHARYGLLVEKQAKSPRARAQAIFVLEAALRRNPGRADVRRRLIALDMDPVIRRFGDAQEHLQVLLKTSPNDPELIDLTGQCEEGNRHYKEAVGYYAKVIGLAPDRVGCYVRQATLLLRELDKAEDAEKLMTQLVQRNPDSFQARLERARYLQGLNRLDEAAKESAEALRLGPKDADVLLVSAQLALAKGAGKEAWEEARKLLSQAVDLHPNDPRMYEALARLELTAGRRDEALHWVQKLKPLSKDPEVLWGLSLVLVDVGEIAEAKDTVNRLRKVGFLPAAVGYVEAHIFAKEEKWLEAVRAVEAARAVLAQSSDLALRASLLLGRCHEQLGNTDQQLAAYRQAVSANPLSDEARLGLAAALVTAGKTDEALKEYSRLLPRRPGLRLVMARALILHNSVLPAEKRSWSHVDQLLEESALLRPEPVELPVYRAEVLSLKDSANLPQALVILEAARDRHGKTLAWWAAMAMLLERQGRNEQALSFLDEATKKLEDGVELRLARARLIARAGGDQATARLIDIEKGLERFSREEQVRLFDALADIHVRRGDFAVAERLWRSVAERQPDNLRAHRLLLDLAIQDENIDRIDNLLGPLRRIEGEEGVVWRLGDAVRMVLLARKGKTDDLAAARFRITEIATRRPNWSRALLLQAQIEELQNNPEQAIEHYRRAIEQGEQHPAVIRRAVQLLFGRRRFAEADQILRQAQERQPASGGDIERMAAEISLLNRDQERALALARKAVSDDSKDYRDHLWLGQMLAAGRDRDKAEESLRRAVQLGPKAPEAWIALAQFLAGNDAREKAKAAIAEARGKLPPEELPLVLGYAYEALGDTKQADSHFDAALAAKPNDPSTLQTVANYHLRQGSVAKAEPLLRSILDPAAKATAAEQLLARRTLAIGLVSGGGYRRAVEAAELIERNLVSSKNAEDLRAKAAVLASNPGTRGEAIRIFEQLQSRQLASAGDQFTLAQLYDLEGNSQRSNELMLGILASHADNPAYVVYYANGLLRRNLIEQAEVWVEKLEKLRPNAWRTVELKARVLHARGLDRDAAQVLLQFARSPGANAVSVALLLEEIAAFDKAEQFYRDLAKEGKPDDAPLLLALFLGRRARTAEALDITEKAWAVNKPEAVADTVSTVIYATPEGIKQIGRAVEQLQAARQRHADSLLIVFQLANLFDLQGNGGEAEKLYREILAKNPSTGAMNNLAWLLAVRREKLPEALALINKAMEIGGPDPGLLDTRGAIYLALDKADAAIQDMQVAVARAPSPARFFRLARAYHASKNRRAASEALDKAQAAGLTPASLHHLERQGYEEILAEIRRPQ